MMLRTLSAALAAAGSLSLPFAAVAAEPVTAKLAQPLANDARVIAGGAMFVCKDASCVAAAPGSRTLALATCKDLAKLVGRIDSFGGERKQLDGDKLGQCNAAAAGDTQVAKR